MPSLLKIGSLLFFLGICTTNFAQTKRDVLHVKDGSILRGELLALDTIMTKKDTLIEQPIRLQGGTILRYSMDEVIKTEQITVADSTVNDNELVIIPGYEGPKKFQLYAQIGLGQSLLGRLSWVSDVNLGFWLGSNMNVGIGTGFDSDNKAFSFQYLIPLYGRFEYLFLDSPTKIAVNAKLGYLAFIEPYHREENIAIEKRKGLHASLGAAVQFPSKQRLRFRVGMTFNYYQAYYRVYTVDGNNFEYQDYSEQSYNTFNYLNLFFYTTF